jgi:hypothetical protein
MQGVLLFPQTEDRTQPIETKLLMIRLKLVPWLETTTAVGMDQPFAVRPSHSHGEVQPRAGQFAAGYLSRAMLSRYSHVRMEAKRCALDGIPARQRAGNERRKKEAEQREQVAVAPDSLVVQESPNLLENGKASRGTTHCRLHVRVACFRVAIAEGIGVAGNFRTRAGATQDGRADGGIESAQAVGAGNGGL